MLFFDASKFKSNQHLLSVAQKNYIVDQNIFVRRLSTATEEDRDGWIKCVQESIRDNPFHRIIAGRTTIMDNPLSLDQSCLGGLRDVTFERLSL